MQKHLIFLAYYYLPQNSSGVQRAVRFAKYLDGPGRCVHVVASSHAGELRDSRFVHSVPNRQISAPEWQSRAARYVQRVLPYNENLGWTPHAIAAAESIMREVPVSQVLSTSPSLSAHFAAWWLKKRHNLNWVADFRDPVFLNPNRARWWGTPYDRFVEKRIFSAADAVVAVTDTVAEGWKNRYPRWRDKFKVVWNGFDPDDGFGPEPIPPSGRRTLAHVGVLYPQRHPSALLESLARLIRNGRVDPSRLRILFVGPMLDRRGFEELSGVSELHERGCLEIHDGMAPRKEANRIIASSDFLLLLDIVDLASKGYTVPAKLYDYILAGRPILAVSDADSPVMRILSQSGIGHTGLHPSDAASEIDLKVLELLSYSSEPRKPSEWFLANFDGRRQAASVAGLLDGMSG